MSNENLQVLPLPAEQWPASLHSVLSDMGGAPINVHKLMAHNPSLLNAWWNFRNYSVDGGTLGKRLGELVILRVSLHLRAWYEWGSHVDRSLRCGITLEEINRVLERNLDTGWQPREAALLGTVDELIASHRLGSTIQHELSKYFTSAQVMDIIAIHGMYVILGCMINTWDLKLDHQVSERVSAHTVELDFNAAVEQFHSGATPPRIARSGRPSEDKLARRGE